MPPIEMVLVVAACGPFTSTSCMHAFASNKSGSSIVECKTVSYLLLDYHNQHINQQIQMYMTHIFMNRYCFDFLQKN